MSPSRGTIARRALGIAGLYAALVAVFVAALTAVYAMPQSAILANLSASYPALEAEGVYPTGLLASDFYRVDGFADTLMLDMAIATPRRSPLYAAMAGENGETPGSTLASEPLMGLRRSISGQRVERPAVYAHYWHGYQVFLRPALTLFRLKEIRFLDLMLLGAMLTATVVLLARRAGPAAAAAFAGALLLTGFYVVPMGLEFSPLYYLVLAACLAVLLSRDSPAFRTRAVEAFFVIGMLTAFVDFLTAPLLSLGMPLAVALVLRGQDDRGETLGSAARYSLVAGLAWLGGYVASWATKVVLAQLILGRDVVGETLASVGERTGAGRGAGLLLQAIGRNLMGLVPTVRLEPGVTGFARVYANLPVLVPAALLLAAAAIAIVWGVLRVPDVRRRAFVLGLAPLPYVWFAVARDHSALHYWFTYRIQAITLFAAGYVALSAAGAWMAGLRRR